MGILEKMGEISTTSVFEFGYLVNEEVSKADKRWNQISEEAFLYLKKLCLPDEGEQKSDFVRFCSYNGQEAIQVKNYAGVLISPGGFQIEILPKVAKHQGDIEASKSSLLMMLEHLNGFRHIQTNVANIATSNIPLFEVFITQFLQSVSRLIKLGLRSDYKSIQNNCMFQKGKVLVGQQIRHNMVNKHKFYVEYDEYLLDRAENRIIHSALLKLHNLTRKVDNQKLLRELSLTFSRIPFSQSIQEELDKITLDRSMASYQTPIAWARLILNELAPTSMYGTANAFSLLFPMESVFEAYVGSILSERLNTRFSLIEQADDMSLVTYKNKSKFSLKPDFLIQNTSRPSNKNVMVLDAKWKLVGSNEGKSLRNLAQSDFYQMFAYGQKYLKGEGNLVLIYPQTDDFEETDKNPYCLDFEDDGLLNLWVIPFIIDEGVDDRFRFKLPDRLIEKSYDIFI